MIAQIVLFLSNKIVTAGLIGYVFLLWLSITVWAAMDVFARTKNWFLRFGCILVVGLLPVLGFVIYLIIRPQTTLEEEKLHTLEEKMLESQSRAFVCPNCLEIVRDDFVFCPNCGLNIRKECPSCQRLLEIVWAQCPYCGVSVGNKTLPPIKETPQIVAERKRSLFRKIFSAPSAAEPIEIKRKRGRPRKEEPLEPEVKRPRGRPRKNDN